MVRGARGPRQPGGGKQIAGLRNQRRFARRHPEVRAERASKVRVSQVLISKERVSQEISKERISKGDGRDAAGPRRQSQYRKAHRLPSRAAGKGGERSRREPGEGYGAKSTPHHPVAPRPAQSDRPMPQRE